MAEFLQKAAALAVGIILAVIAFVFASVVLALAAAIALVVGGWLWWRTRHLRREMRRQAEALQRREGAVIEGEYRRIDER